MPRQYSPRSFLRLTDRELVGRYFRSSELLIHFEFNAKSGHDDWVEELYTAWQELPDDQRAAVDADFTRVNELADDRGTEALLQEVTLAESDLRAALERVDGAHDRAMLVFLEAPGLFDIAERFTEAFARPPTQWHRRRAIPDATATVTERALRSLSTALSMYLRETEGRGASCSVESYFRNGKQFLFAYPEDFGVTELQYVSDRLERRPVRPAFEIVFAYSAEEHALDVLWNGSKKRIVDLQEIFGRTILDVELGPMPAANRVLDLNKLKSRDYRFVYGITGGIRDVVVRRLRLSGVGGMNIHHTIEADPKIRRDAIYDGVESAFSLPGDGCTCGKTPLALMNVSQVRLTVMFAPDGKRGRRTRTFELGSPNRIGLGHEGRDAYIRQMLADSRIDLTTHLAA